MNFTLHPLAPRGTSGERGNPIEPSSSPRPSPPPSSEEREKIASCEICRSRIYRLPSWLSRSLRLFITTITVLPSCPTTPMVSGIRPRRAKQTSTATVPNEIMRFYRMIRRALWLRRKAAKKFSSRSCINTTSACSSAASAPRAPIATPT